MKKTYSEKLRNPKWQKKRLEILSRDNFTCQLCSDTETELHVHHKSYQYGKEPYDYPNDNFQTLCRKCHLVVEFIKKDYPDLKGEINCSKIIYTYNFLDMEFLYALLADDYAIQYRIENNNVIRVDSINREDFNILKKLFENG